MWNMLLNFNRNIEAHIFELCPFRGLSTVSDVYNHYYYCYIKIIIIIITIIILSLNSSLCYSHERTWHHEHQHFVSPFKFLKWICGKNKIAYRSSFFGGTHPHQVVTPKIYGNFPHDTMSDQTTTVVNPVYSLFYWNLSCLLQSHSTFCCYCCFLIN